MYGFCTWWCHIATSKCWAYLLNYRIEEEYNPLLRKFKIHENTTKYRSSEMRIKKTIMVLWGHWSDKHGYWIINWQYYLKWFLTYLSMATENKAKRKKNMKIIMHNKLCTQPHKPVNAGLRVFKISLSSLNSVLIILYFLKIHLNSSGITFHFGFLLCTEPTCRLSFSTLLKFCCELQTFFTRQQTFHLLQMNCHKPMKKE